MINEIENAIVSLLTAKLASARKIAVQKGTAGIAQPAVYASVESGSFERIGQNKSKLNLTVWLDIIFSNLKDQKERREGINLILEGAVQLLLQNDLGLNIHPLEPKNWKNTTTEEFDELGMISYSLELSTFYHLAKLDTEITTDLLRVGMECYLQDVPDSTADATELIDLPLLP